MCQKTRKSQKICTIIFGVCSLIFIVLGVVLPIILHSLIVEMAKNNVIMTPETHNLWGMVPGDTKMLIYRTLHFFNFQNPYEAIFLNETPVFQETIPYEYQEFQNYTNCSFRNLPNSSVEVVDFNFWDYMKKLPQGNESDIITVANLPAFGAWFQLQNSEKFLLSIQSMSQLIGGLENLIIDFALSQGVTGLFITKEQAIKLFTTSAIDAFKANQLWEDHIFGWKNATTFVAWVQAANEGLYNEKSTILKDYFHLTYTQMSPLISTISPNIKSIMLLITNMYCANKTNLTCDGRYLAALQWSQQGITMNPPGGIGASKSIISSNRTADGYPEISYYYSEYFLEKVTNATPYLNITFDVNWAYNLLARSGDPKNWLKAPYLIFHQGNLKFLFNQGAIFDKSNDLKDLEPIKDRFRLKDIYQTHVFWKYMDYIVMDFAMMSSQNGTRETLGLGAFSSQYLYSAFMEMKDFLLNDITSKSILANLTDSNIDCIKLFNSSLEDISDRQLKSICENDINLIKFDSDSMQFLSNLCLNQYDAIWMKFMKDHNLTIINMLELCDPNYGYLGNLIKETNIFIKDFYDCDAADYCSEYEIAYRQWGQSKITLNPPPILKGRIYNSSFSVSDWNPTKFIKPIEYLGFLNVTKLNRSSQVTDKDCLGINVTATETLLSFDCLFNAVMNSKAFIFYLNNDFQNFSKNFLVENPLLLLNYLRYVTFEFAFGGITVQKNVSDLVLGYESPFVKTMRDTDPAEGGNPSLNPTIAFCPNNTLENALYNPQSMYTGKGDVSKVRTYYSVYNNQNIVQWIAEFDGNETRNITKNPYNQDILISGTDGFTDKPDLNIEKDTFDVFVSILMRYGTAHGFKDSSKKYNGLNGYLFRMDNSLINKNPIFNQNKWTGFLNFTSLMSAPVLISKRHYLDADKKIFEFIEYLSTDNETITPCRENDDIALYVEPYSGLSLSAWLRLQNSVELSNNLLFNSSYAMLPIVSISRGGDISDETVESLLGPLKLGILFENIISRVICFVIGGILLIVTFILTYKYCKQNKKEEVLLENH